MCVKKYVVLMKIPFLIMDGFFYRFRCTCISAVWCDYRRPKNNHRIVNKPNVDNVRVQSLMYCIEITKNIMTK